MPVLITPVDAGFPANFSGNLEAFKNAIIANLSFTAPDDTVMAGRVGGAAPTSNVGPWLDSGVWKVWSGSAYVPAAIVVGDSGHQARLIAPGLTADRDYTLPDRTGVIATTDDLYGGRPAVILTGTTPDIDWSASNNFYQSISANTTYKFLNGIPGQEIFVVVVATGAFTATFPTTVSWGTGTTIAQTSTGTDVYIFKNVAGAVYGRKLLNVS